MKNLEAYPRHHYKVNTDLLNKQHEDKNRKIEDDALPCI